MPVNTYAEQCRAYNRTGKVRCSHTVLPSTRRCAAGHYNPAEGLWTPYGVVAPAAPSEGVDYEELFGSAPGGAEEARVPTAQVAALWATFQPDESLPPWMIYRRPEPEETEPDDSGEPRRLRDRLPVRMAVAVASFTRRLVRYGSRFVLREWWKLARNLLKFG